ncbi:hypothetical protein [uncultured Ramlibacter sp.]|nr:hypothetical protein [uncultured Ramlibacter sp.]
MDLLAGIPDWLIWSVAGAAGMVAAVAVANTIRALLDFETQ